MRVPFVIIVLLNTALLFAAASKDSISIRGVGSFYKNSTIELLIIDDYITHKEVVVQSKSVD